MLQTVEVKIGERVIRFEVVRYIPGLQTVLRHPGEENRFSQGATFHEALAEALLFMELMEAKRPKPTDWSGEIK